MKSKDWSFLDILVARLIRKFGLIFIVFFMESCALLSSGRFLRYDERSISVLSLNLFDQRTAPLDVEQSWKGDWLFRRERLELVDRALLEVRPDLLAFQQMISRKGSPSESDQSILSFGALDGYQWHLDMVNFYEDTQEEQYFGLAIGLPLQIGEKAPSSNGKLGVDGYYSINRVMLQEQGVWLVNVQMPKKAKKVDVWYDVLERKLSAFLNKHQICRQRVIVAGYLPGRSSWPFYQEFLAGLELKDTSSGFCEVAQDCHTANPRNELFFVSSDGKSGSQSERILAHNQTIVYSSKPAINESSSGTRRSAWIIG